MNRRGFCAVGFAACLALVGCGDDGQPGSVVSSDTAVGVGAEDASSPADAASDATASTDTASTDTDPTDTDNPVNTATGMVVMATLETRIVHHDGSGPNGFSGRISPERGLAWGERLGEPAYIHTTPDGGTVLVWFQRPDTGAALYALKTDGSAAPAPQLLAEAAAPSSLELAIHNDYVAFVDNGDDDADEARLYVVRYDGSPPLHVASGTQWKVERLKLGGDRLVWEDGDEVRSAALDGSEVDAPKTMAVPTNGPKNAQGVLPDGRVVIQAAKRLWVADESGAVAVTPGRFNPRYWGFVDGGDRLIVELWTSSTGGPEQLVSVSSSTDAEPMPLHNGMLEGLEVFVLDDDSVVFSAKDDTGWRVFEHQSGATTPLCAGSPTRLWLTDALRSRPAVGVRDDGAVLRFDRPGNPSELPAVLHSGVVAVNHSKPWPSLQLTSEEVVYSMNTSEGWLTWRTRLDGSQVSPIAHPPTSSVTVHRSGATWLDYRLESAPVWMSDGAVQQLADRQDGKLTGQLNPSGSAVLWRADAWWAADLSPDPAPRKVAESGDLVGFAGDHAIFYTAGASQDSVRATDQSSMAVPLLTSRIWPVIDGDGVVGLDGDDVVRTDPSMPSEPPLPLMSAPFASQLTIVGEYVVAATDYPAALVAAKLDGSHVGAPITISGPTDGWPLAVVPIGDSNRALVVLSIQATAVPHPDQAAVVDLNAIPTLTPVLPPYWTVAIQGPSTSWDFGFGKPSSPPTPVWSGDHALVVAHSPDGLVLAATDGSDASAPMVLGGPTDLVPHSVSPSGTRVVLTASDGVYLSEFTQGSSSRVIEADIPYGGVQTWWTDAGSVVISGSSPTVFGTSGVTTFDPQSGVSTPLGSGLSIVKTYGLNPDQSAIVVEVEGDDDRSIWGVPLDGAPAFAFTAPDDLTYDVVGFSGP